MMDRDRFPVDPWRLVETSFALDDVGVTETLFAVGNGYVGMRGNHAEGRFAHEHGTFVNGLHETFPIRHAEQAYGFAEVGQTIINAPDPKVMRVYVDDEPLSLDVADVADYERSLDMRDGVLRRRIRWRTPSGKEVLRVAGIYDRFAVVMDGVIAERDHLASKPAPDVFVEAARMLGADPARSAAVEDALSGVQSAVAGGFGLVVGVDRGVGSDVLREAGAHVVVADLEEFIA